MNEAVTFHLLCNAHMDPVWMWDRREGLGEGINTCRAVLDLMDENPDLTFCRGEASVYEYIERHDPETFRRIRGMVEAGRWEIVGGTYIQADGNLVSEETLCRNFELGMAYFRRAFGRRPTVGWSADCFGHSGGYPEILAAAGMTSFLCTRPPHGGGGNTSFWWEGAGGARLLAYRPPEGLWYGCARGGARAHLDATLRSARETGRRHLGVFLGLGNHGGGPTRAQLRDIRAWAREHSDVETVFSGMGRFMDALRAEAEADPDWPVRRGELNFVLRGCYSSCARIKFEYRGLEHALARAETVEAMVRLAADASMAPADGDALAEARESCVFNAFHDIVPGTLGGRPAAEQLRHIGLGRHRADAVEDRWIRALALAVDTQTRKPPSGDLPRPVALLAVNPSPRPWRGLLPLDAMLDWRPIEGYYDRVNEVPLWVADAEGNPLPAQRVENECQIFERQPWRARCLVETEIPAGGWSLYELGLGSAERPPPPPAGSAAAGEGGNGPWISAGAWRVEARPGASAVAVSWRGVPVFPDAAGGGFSAALFADPHGSWGDMSERDVDLQNELERFAVRETRVLERGPLRSALWVRLAGVRSRLELVFRLDAPGDGVEVSARAFMDERGRRLKLLMPGVRGGSCGTPAGERTTAGGLGEMPMMRWASLDTGTGRYGFATPDLSDVNFTSDAFQATVARSAFYADETGWIHDRERDPHRPVMDAGEIPFSFAWLRPGMDVQAAAEAMERPPLVVAVAARPGPAGRTGSVFSLADRLDPGRVVRLLGFRSEGAGVFQVRLFNPGHGAVHPELRLGGAAAALEPLPGGAVGTWRLRRADGGAGWHALRIPIGG